MMAARSQSSPEHLAGLLRGLAPVAPEADVPVTGLAMDSRHVRRGDLFLACAGASAHGLDFLREALDRGAAAVVWEPVEGVSAPRWLGDRPCIAVPGLGKRAGELAARFYGDPSSVLRVIGVTGTNGKSTMVHLLAGALEGRPGACGRIGTLGYGLSGTSVSASHTTPDAVRVQQLLAEMLAGGATHVAMEASSHALDQARVSAVRFTTAAFTNLSHEHLDYHRDIASYARSKARLFTTPGLESAVVMTDDPYARQMIDAVSGARIVTVSREETAPAGSDMHIHFRVESRPAGISLSLVSGDRRARVESCLFGEFNGENLALAAAVLVAEGMELEEAASVLAPLPAPPGRMERWEVPDGPTVVVDYAHSPDALAAALEALRAHASGRLSVVFGCGGERDVEKRPLMGAIAERLADRVMITDDNPRHEDPAAIVEDILRGVTHRDAVMVEHDRELAIRRALEAAGPGDLVLVAGKGHETYQERGGERRSYSDRGLVAELAGQEPDAGADDGPRGGGA